MDNKDILFANLALNADRELDASSSRRKSLELLRETDEQLRQANEHLREARKHLDQGRRIRNVALILLPIAGVCVITQLILSLCRLWGN